MSGNNQDQIIVIPGSGGSSGAPSLPGTGTIPTIDDIIGGRQKAILGALIKEYLTNDPSMLPAQLSQSVLTALGAATDAGLSANNAQEFMTRALDAALSAEATGDVSGTFPDVAAGVAGVADGEYFRVPQPAPAKEAFKYYRRTGTTATEVTSTPSGSALMDIAETTSDLIERVKGWSAYPQSKHPFEIVDSAGKAVLFMDDQGLFHFPGGVTLSSLQVENIVISMLLKATAAEIGKLTVDQMITTGGWIDGKKGSGYLLTETDREGRIIWGTKLDGSKEYLGYPLSQQVGQMKNDFFFIGDSITAFTETTSGAYNDTNRNQKPAVCSQGWPVWAELLSGGKILKTGISATGGFRADQILATHVPVAVAAKPRFCVVLAGRNNVVQSANYSLDVTIAAMTQIYDTLRKAGITPVCCSMSAQTGNTSAQDIMRYALNEWIRSYAEKYQLPFVDMHAATTDPQTGEWLAGLNYDASHPNAEGARLMGQALVDAMLPWVSGVVPRLAVNAVALTDSTNHMRNPLFYDMDATDATLPDGWVSDAAGSAVVADASAADKEEGIKGRVFKVTGTDAAPGRRSTIAIPVAAGEIFELSFKCKFGTATENNIWIHSAAQPFDTTGILGGIRRWAAINDQWGVYSQRFVIPAGVSSVRVAVIARDISIAQLGLFKITEVQ